MLNIYFFWLKIEIKLILEEYMTLWASLSEYTYKTWSICMHMTVIRMWLRLQVTEVICDTPKIKTKV